MIKRVYIAGKITGIPLDEAEEKFSIAQALLEEHGYEAVNPLEEGKKIDYPTYEKYILQGLNLLSSCDTICFLPDWERSRGAVLEEHYARITKKNVIYLESIL